MPLDPGVLTRSRAALALWRELQHAYDAIARALAGADGRELGALAERIVALEHELKPLVAERAALKSRAAQACGDAADGALMQVWRETDAVIESLAERQPVLVRAAREARHETAQRLHDAQRARARVRSYEPSAAPARLASRHA